MTLSFSTQDLSIAKKFSLPSFLYCFGLFVIGVSISVFYVDLRNSNELINDLTSQKNSLSKLEANIALTNEDLVQILYLKNYSRIELALARVENYRPILNSFKDLSDKHDFINDRSLAEEFDPVIQELQVNTKTIVEFVLNGRLERAKKLYEREYLIGVRQVMNFSRDALYGKSDQIDKIYLNIRSREEGFVALLITEFFITFVLIYFLHRLLAQQLIVPVDKLYSATREIVKKYSQDTEGEGEGEGEEWECYDGEYSSAISVLKKIDSNDEIGKLCRNFRRMAWVVEKGTAEIKLANKLLVDAQDQLVQSSKLASIGSISAGLAHELNQPLGVIKLDAQLSKKIVSIDTLASRKVVAKLDSIINQVDRAARIINHLKIFSRQTSHEPELVDLNWLIDESLVMLTQSLNISGISLIRELDASLPEVKCDYIKIEQVLTNLFTNARDALVTEDEKSIVVRSYTVNDMVCVDVEDSGCGMEKTVIERVFDPFFTTKDVGKGMGLGMSISYGIIKDHNGTLTIKSAPGHGARFTMSLPVDGAGAKTKPKVE